MAESVEAFFRFVHACYIHGREEAYVARCAIPMTVYSDAGEEISMAPTEAQAVDLLRTAWDNIRAVAATVEPKVISIGLPQRIGFPVRVDWALHDGEGRHLLTSELRYFLNRRRDGRLRIELVEVFGAGCARPLDMPPVIGAG
jgi:hypothetical protein